MSIFFPLRGQYEALRSAFRELPVIRRQDAARRMNVHPRRVEQRLEKMIRKGYYKDTTPPYYDQDIDALVSSPRYQTFAKVYIGAGDLKAELLRMQALIRDRMNTRYSLAQRARPQVVGRFLEDLSGGLRSGSVGKVIAKKGQKFMRSLLDPGSTFEEDPVENALMEVLGLIENDCTTLLQLMPTRQDRNYARFQPLLLTAAHRVKAVEQCLPEGNAAERIALSTIPTANRLARELREETLAQFDDALKELMRPPRRPMTPTEELIAQLETEARQLRTLSSQLPETRMKNSLTTIAGKLDSIRAQLLSSPAEAPAALVRSLKNTYLPMMDQLLTQYMRTPYSSSADATFAATEEVFAVTLPQAFDRIQKDIGTSNAIDLQSNAEALVKKMQLDGLLPMDFGKGA